MEGVELFTSAADLEMLAMLRREGRASCAADFRNDYSFGPGFEGRSCIWPSGVDSWSENSSGIMWIGVHGKNSICVVTKACDLDVKRVHNRLIFLTKEEVSQRFRRAIISELDDLADRSSELRKRRDPTINMPFGVVSVCPVIPATDKAYRCYKESVYKTFVDNKMNRYWELMFKDLNIGQTSSDEQGKGNGDNSRDEVFLNILKREKMRLKYLPCGQPLHCYDKTTTIMHLQNNTGTTSTNGGDAIQAIDKFYDVDAKRFLLQKMMKREAFNIDETIQIAISAFQQLFKKDFEAAELGVSVMDPEYFVSCEDMYTKDIYIKHLEKADIERHLAAIKLSEKGEIKQHLAVTDAGNGDDLLPNKRKRVESSSSSGIHG